MILKDCSVKYVGEIDFEPGWLHLHAGEAIVGEGHLVNNQDCTDLTFPSYRVKQVIWNAA